jgi:hypothetical protein
MFLQDVFINTTPGGYEALLTFQGAGIKGESSTVGRTRETQIALHVPTVALGEPAVNDALAQILVPATAFPDTSTEVAAGPRLGNIGPGYYRGEGEWHDLSLGAVVGIAREAGAQLLDADITAINFRIPLGHIAGF